MKSKAPKGWHRADVVAAIHKRGTSLAALARDHNLSDAALRASLSAPRAPSNLIISKFLAVPLHELWPEWFDEAGQLLVRNRRKARTRPSSQKRSNKLNRAGARA